jgi:hypothetical protein
MLSPSQIQRMCTNYFVADYEVRLRPFLMENQFTEDVLFAEPHLARDSSRRGVTCGAK